MPKVHFTARPVQRLVLSVVIAAGLLAAARFAGPALQDSIGPAPSGVLGLLMGGFIGWLMWWTFNGFVAHIENRGEGGG